MSKPAAMPVKPPLVTVRGVDQVFQRGSGAEQRMQLILHDINLTLQDNEIVALLGRSGSGKSTLLRNIAGLLAPTRGVVTIEGHPVKAPAAQVAMVFQTFALFPWLSVLENVEIGLEARGMPANARRERAMAAIDLIGLEGYESAYPKELSGGMRQRVGLARALVVHPKVLLMDEPFSALDVLTAETLRTDLLDLWFEGRMPISAILMVTHNIEEAVFMTDRILVLSSNPGQIVAEFTVDLPQPRSRTAAAFRQLVDDIYARMTEKRKEEPERDGVFPGTGAAMVLPDVEIGVLFALMKAVEGKPYNGKAHLPALAANLQLDDLFSVADILQLLRFAEVGEGDIRLTDDGRRLVHADPIERKGLFAQHLMMYVPLIAQIRRVLDERETRRALAGRFRDELEDNMSKEEAERTMSTAISFARYAEVFAYDERWDTLSLNEHAGRNEPVEPAAPQ